MGKKDESYRLLGKVPFYGVDPHISRKLAVNCAVLGEGNAGKKSFIYKVCTGSFYGTLGKWAWRDCSKVVDLPNEGEDTHTRYCVNFKLNNKKSEDSFYQNIHIAIYCIDISSSNSQLKILKPGWKLI